MNVNVLFKILTFNIFLNITNGCCCLNPKPGDVNPKLDDVNPKLDDAKPKLEDVNPKPDDVNLKPGDDNPKPGDAKPKLEDVNPKPDDVNLKPGDVNPKPENGKEYIAEALGINEDDFLDIQMFDDDNNLRKYIKKIKKSSLKYSSFVVLEIFKFDKEIKGHNLACQYMEELSEKKCFYCAFIRENVEIKINNDLLELDYGSGTLDKNLETINNKKKLRHLHIMYSTKANDNLYFCKKNSINI